MNKRKDKLVAEDNIRIVHAALQTARNVLFFDLTLAGARKNQRVRELEWKICDAIRAAQPEA